MNIPYLIAGGICLLATPVHIFGGEHTLKQVSDDQFPTIQNGDGTVAKQEIRMGWHLFDIDLLFGGIVLLLLGLTDIFDKPTTMAHILGVYYAGYSIVILIAAIGLKRRDSLMRLPQWILTLLVAGLTFIGAS